MPTSRASLNRLSLTQLCEVTGRSDEFVRKALAIEPRIEPASRTNREVWYAAPAAVERVITGAGGLNPVAEKARLDAARADLAELDLAQKRGELVPASDLDRALIALATTVSARLQAIPARLAPEVSAEAKPAACQAIISRAIKQALHDLAESGRLAAERAALEAAAQEARPGSASPV